MSNELGLPEEVAAAHEAAMHFVSQGLVRLIADEKHEGRIPTDHEAFLEEILEAHYPMRLRHLGGLETEDWLRLREELASYVRTAIETEELCRKAHWKN
jgi:hypothetical protein